MSSRTYLSSLERGIKAPTITKVEEIATVIGVHPLLLIVYAYLPSSLVERAKFWGAIAAEIGSFYYDAPRLLQAKFAEFSSSQLLELQLGRGVANRSAYAPERT